MGPGTINKIASAVADWEHQTSGFRLVGQVEEMCTYTDQENDANLCF